MDENNIESGQDMSNFLFTARTILGQLPFRKMDKLSEEALSIR